MTALSVGRWEWHVRFAEGAINAWQGGKTGVPERLEIGLWGPVVVRVGFNRCAQGLKPHSVGTLLGTTEVVPFP